MTRRARNTCSREGCGEPAAGRGLCNTHHAALRYRLRAYGTWDPDRAPIGPPRERVEALRALGIGTPRLEALTGVRGDTLHRLSRPGREHCSRRVYAAVMAIPMPEAAYRMAQPGANVSSVGTVRRLRALAVIGWPNGYIADRLGLSDPAGLNKVYVGRRRCVTARRAAAVADLFDELWDQPGPSERHRRWAASKGWAPPLAWDDDTIEDPAACPDAPGPLDAVGRAYDLLDRYADLIDHVKADHATAAFRLGYDKPSSLKRALSRAKATVERCLLEEAS